MNEESGMETYITICKISSQWNWPYDAGSSNPVLCDSLDAVGVGGEVQEAGNMCIPMADSC